MLNIIKKIKNKISLTLFSIFANIIIVQNSFAQSSSIGVGMPSSDDLSVQFIGKIFGSLVGTIIGGGGDLSDPFGNSIPLFNGMILTVGGILAAYTILAGTLGTAHDGEMLGKKFSSVWIPIRYSLGTALILPILPGGYCVMQGIVLWIVFQGVSIANTVWSGFMQNPNEVATATSGTQTKIRTILEDIYKAQACVTAHNNANALTSPSMRSLDDDYQANSPVNNVNTVTKITTWRFGDKYGTAQCGHVEIPVPDFSTKVSHAPTTALSSMNGLEELYKTADITPIYDAHVKAIGVSIGEIGNLVTSKVLITPTINNNTPNPIPAIDTDTKKVQVSAQVSQELDKIAIEYNNTIKSAVSSLVQQKTNPQAAQAAQKQGWFLAGTWITQSILNQNKISSIVNVNISSEAFKYIGESVNKEYSEQALNASYKVLGNMSSKGTANPNSNDGSDDRVGMSGKVAEWLAGIVTTIDLEDIKKDTRHPLILMTEIGNRMFNSIIAWMTIVMGASLVAGVKAFGISFDLVPALLTFFGSLAFPIASFIGIAGLLAYLLPNIPFLIWIGIIIGWTIMVIEAVLAAPLWAVMHLHPNGDDLTGRGGNGYMLVLGLLLRPVLIVFGVISAIILSGLFGQFINRVFFDVFSASLGGESLGFFAIIFGTGLYAAAMYNVIKHTFSLMHVIPDQLMRWVGGGGEQLGQYAGGMGEGSIGRASSIGGAAAGLFAEKGIGAIGQGAQHLNNMKKHKDQLNSQEKGNSGDLNHRYGEGHSDAQDAIKESMKGMGKLAIDKAQDQAKFSSSMLGGHHSIAYNGRLQDNLASGQSFSEAQESAFQQTYDEKYGSGAYEVAKGIAASALPEGHSGANNPISTNIGKREISRTTSILNEKLGRGDGSIADGSSFFNTIKSQASSDGKFGDAFGNVFANVHRGQITNSDSDSDSDIEPKNIGFNQEDGVNKTDI